MLKNILLSLDKSSIETGKFPILELLENSCYYPCCDLDAGVIKHFSHNFDSFIYVDYGVERQKLLDNIHNFKGYDIVGMREVDVNEVFKSDWDDALNKYVNPEKYQKLTAKDCHYIYWIVYERANHLDDSHGSKRFSLLFFASEGVATFKALYWNNRLSPKAVAIIQPGTGTGGNWTNFRTENGYFGKAVLENPYGTPQSLFVGGNGKRYKEIFHWTNYTFQSSIDNYYGFGTELTIWQNNNI